MGSYSNFFIRGHSTHFVQFFFVHSFPIPFLFRSNKNFVWKKKRQYSIESNRNEGKTKIRFCCTMHKKIDLAFFWFNSYVSSLRINFKFFLLYEIQFYDTIPEILFRSSFEWLILDFDKTTGKCPMKITNIFWFCQWSIGCENEFFVAFSKIHIWFLREIKTSNNFYGMP